ncbi:hypothetical protein E2C01_074607 [Portunus trituberculatus]|uniref:Kazal-like domain-containing protein n=1 Tax=Portunus trituberculatus TaxID=210409 RepID=A0A5B7ICP2_PORTR|nr:hypothetical protein [Portunus trituberculatus]
MYKGLGTVKSIQVLLEYLSLRTQMREATRLAGLVVVVVVLTTGVDAEQKSIDIVTTVPSCPWPCPDYHQPVCGNNGKTYANPCRLHEAIACENSCIQQVAVGPCGEWLAWTNVCIYLCVFHCLFCCSLT